MNRFAHNDALNPTPMVLAYLPQLPASAPACLPAGRRPPARVLAPPALGLGEALSVKPGVRAAGGDTGGLLGKNHRGQSAGRTDH